MFTFRSLITNVSFTASVRRSNKLGPKCFHKLSTSSSNHFVSVVEDEENKTAKLILHRPPVNVLNLEFIEQITTSIKELERKKFRGCILSSNLPTVFSAGFDITELHNPEEKRLRTFLKSSQELWKTLMATPLIMIAAINGHAPAGGCVMALCCDYRIMVNGKGKIGLNETQLGIAVPEWLFTLTSKVIGYRQAEKALCLGSLPTPEEAFSLGMIDELVSDNDELKAKVMYQMALWLKIPETAFKMTKAGLWKQLVDDLDTHGEKEVEEMMIGMQSDVFQKTLENYVKNLKEKRV